MEWISVDERLPNDPREVIVWIKNAGLYLAYYNTLPEYKCWMMNLGEKITGVTCWQPLPDAPPKEWR